MRMINPSIFLGYHYFWKQPCMHWKIIFFTSYQLTRSGPDFADTHPMLYLLIRWHIINIMDYPSIFAYNAEVCCPWSGAIVGVSGPIAGDGTVSQVDDSQVTSVGSVSNAAPSAHGSPMEWDSEDESVWWRDDRNCSFSCVLSFGLLWRVKIRKKIDE